MARKQSHSLIPDAILARRCREDEQYRQNLERRQAERDARDRLGAAGGKVEDLGQDYELNLRTDEEYLRQWVRAIAAQKVALVALPDHALPDPAAPPAWVPNHDAWGVAVCILQASNTYPNRAMTALVDLAMKDPNLAVAVAGCLRREIRRATTPALEVVAYEPAPSEQDGEFTVNDTPAERLIVDLTRKTITLDGKTYDVSSTSALRWVKVLASHPGEWISGTDLEKYDSELQNPRTDRWRQHLPELILCLIDSETGKGSRIRL